MTKVVDVYVVNKAYKLGLIKKGARIRTDGSTTESGPQFTGTIVGISSGQFYVSWDDKEGGSYDKCVIYFSNTRARIEFLDDDEDTTFNKKEESKSMTGNTMNVAVNGTIMKVLKEEPSEVAMRVNKYFCNEIPNNFTGEMLLADKKDKFIGEAINRENEDKKKAAKEG